MKINLFLASHFATSIVSIYICNCVYNRVVTHIRYIWKRTDTKGVYKRGPTGQGDDKVE
jgi:hypothetical protein